MKRIYKNFSDPHIICQKTFNFRKFFIFLIILLIICACAAACWLIFTNYNRIKLDKQDYYLLVLEQSESLAEAQEFSAQIISSGGSGYILNDEKFKVCAAVYLKESDANSVLTRLISAYPQAEIKKISIKTKRIAGIDKDENDNLSAAINFVPALIKDVLQKNLELDGLEAAESAIISELGDFSAQLQTHMQNLARMYEAHKGEGSVEKTMSFFEGLNEWWADVVSLTEQTSVSVKLKQISCKAAYEYYLFRQSL